MRSLRKDYAESFKSFGSFESFASFEVRPEPLPRLSDCLNKLFRILIGLPSDLRTRAKVVSDCELCACSCPFFEVVADRLATGESPAFAPGSARLLSERELPEAGKRVVLTEQSDAELQLDSLSFSTAGGFFSSGVDAFVSPAFGCSAAAAAGSFSSGADFSDFSDDLADLSGEIADDLSDVTADLARATKDSAGSELATYDELYELVAVDGRMDWPLPGLADRRPSTVLPSA